MAKCSRESGAGVFMRLRSGNRTTVPQRTAGAARAASSATPLFPAARPYGGRVSHGTFRLLPL